MSTTSPPTSIRRSRRRKTWPAAVWLAVSGTITLGAFLAASQTSDAATDDILYDPGLALSAGVFYGVIIAISLLVGLAYPNPRKALGFRRFRLRWVWISFAIVVATTIVSVAVEPYLHGGEDQGFRADRWEPDHAAAFAANAFVLVLLGPFAEELFFRGLGVRVFVRAGGLLAILVTGIVFGLAHGILGALPPLVLFGIGLGWVRLRSASIWPSFIGHAAFNGLGVAVLVISWLVDAPV